MLRLQARAPKGIEHLPFRVERQFMVLCEKGNLFGLPDEAVELNERRSARPDSPS